MKVETKSARIRNTLPHPVVDGDGHWLESFPILLEYFREIGGPKLTEKLLASWIKLTGRTWYEMSSAERMRQRQMRVPWWTISANTLDRATGLVPGLLNERLQEFGVDFALIYPSVALGALTMQDPDIRRTFIRAYNTMAADLFAPYRDRLTPVAIVPVHNPQEAIEEAEHAVRTLGMKSIVIGGWVRRPIGVDEDWQPDLARRRQYIDCIAHDSLYDYDPFWAKCAELKVAVTTHVGSMGWADRSSPTSFVSNHLGHFAQGNHLFARGLVMGGVVQRFPKLKFAFLEGGAGWACNLLLDLVGHWKKRNSQAMRQHLAPDITNKDEMRMLFEQFATHPRFQGKIEEIIDRNLVPTEPSRTAEYLTRRDTDEDEFPAFKITNADEIRRIFSESFYIGCEADDPTVAWAFDSKINRAVLQPMFSSDITHWDVVDMREVLEEAHELLEYDLVSLDQFRKFTFSNVVSLHAGMNPDFFKGTVVESAVAEEMAKSRNLEDDLYCCFGVRKPISGLWLYSPVKRRPYSVA